MVDEACTVDVDIEWGESIAIIRKFDEIDDPPRVYQGPKDDAGELVTYLQYMMHERVLRLTKDNIP